MVKRDAPKEETTVKIGKAVYDDFKDYAESKGMEIKTTITKLVSSYTAKQRLYERYRPFLSITRVQDNTVSIYDHKLNRNVTVTVGYINDRHETIFLRCDTCQDNEQCVHVAHAAVSDEVGEAHLNLKKSQKKKLQP